MTGVQRRNSMSPSRVSTAEQKAPVPLFHRDRETTEGNRRTTEKKEMPPRMFPNSQNSSAHPEENSNAPPASTEG
jgi:hypothetical protein